MKYAFTCPAPGCGHLMTVDAADKEGAKTEFLQACKDHCVHSHPDMKMGDADMMKMLDEKMMMIEEKPV